MTTEDQVATIAELRERLGKASRYAEQLAVSLGQKHFPENTDWQPLSGDLLGLLTQIDNITTALVRKETAEARATAAERALVDLQPCVKFALAWDDCDGVSDEQMEPIIKAAAKAAKSYPASARLAADVLEAADALHKAREAVKARGQAVLVQDGGKELVQAVRDADERFNAAVAAWRAGRT